jgi:hypothetical protein
MNNCTACVTTPLHRLFFKRLCHIILQVYNACALHVCVLHQIYVQPCPASLQCSSVFATSRSHPMMLHSNWTQPLFHLCRCHHPVLVISCQQCSCILSCVPQPFCYAARFCPMYIALETSAADESRVFASDLVCVHEHVKCDCSVSR